MSSAKFNSKKDTRCVEVKAALFPLQTKRAVSNQYQSVQLFLPKEEDAADQANEEPLTDDISVADLQPGTPLIMMLTVTILPPLRP
jgi:hypothetical protein